MASVLAPLVAPGPALTPDQYLRYSRHLPLPAVGEEGQRRLMAARVLVVGAGGLGAPVLMYLAAAGVGTIGIVDPDVVELSNLQRQVIHGMADIGGLKSASAAASMAELNPDVQVIEHRTKLTAANAAEICLDYDLIIDGTDNFPTRYLTNDIAVLQGKPLVSGSILGFEGQVSVYWATHGPHYRDVFPVPPPVGSVPDCASGGVLGVLCGVIGSVMATEAVKLICGIGEPLLGRVLFYDAAAMSFRTIKIKKDPAGQPVTTLIDYDQFCGVPPRSSASEIVGLTPAELAAEMAGGPVLLVDVREPAEFAALAIPGAKNIPVDQITSADRLAQITAGARVVLYCQTGVRSTRAAQALAAAKVADVAQLTGGILAWLAWADTRHNATDASI